ncbi:MAG: hypothetical protein ACK4SF_14720 [Algoriphagus aquaeductus]
MPDSLPKKSNDMKVEVKKPHLRGRKGFSEESLIFHLSAGFFLPLRQ